MRDYTSGKLWKMEKKLHIMEEAFRLFSQKGIEAVTIPEVAAASGVGRATVYRYFVTKLDLVVAIGTWKWAEYIRANEASQPAELLEKMTGAERLHVFLDAFLDLYRNHRDILIFNYNFNSFLRYEAVSSDQKQPYLNLVDYLGQKFHELYESGCKDGTINSQISESEMFSGSFHIMLAAVTRYAVGLVYIPENGVDPENELLMLEELFLSRFTNVL